MLFATLLTASLLMVPALGALTIDTIGLTQCQDATIKWKPDDNSKGPFNLIVAGSEDPCNIELADLGDHDGTSMNWKVNLIGGLNVQLSLQDFNGDEAWSASIEIAKSDDHSCLSPEDAAKVAPSSSAPAPASTPAASHAAAPALSSASTSSSGAAEKPPSQAAAGPVQAAGAAGGGLLSGAIGLHSASTPIMVLSAVGAAVALFL